jgi:proteasome lid subunit RPN8/RPN11
MSQEHLHLHGDLTARIEGILESVYPNEGCGVLLGRVEDNKREVIRAVSSQNTWDERSDRYRIDPDIVHRLMGAEEENGLRIVGFYHSHPDADPLPSATDRELAWPWYHYVIWPVRRGVAGHPRAWRLTEARFLEIDLRLSEFALSRLKSEPKETTDG